MCFGLGTFSFPLCHVNSAFFYYQFKVASPDHKKERKHVFKWLVGSLVLHRRELSPDSKEICLEVRLQTNPPLFWVRAGQSSGCLISTTCIVVDSKPQRASVFTKTGGVLCSKYHDFYSHFLSPCKKKVYPCKKKSLRNSSFPNLFIVDLNWIVLVPACQSFFSQRILQPRSPLMGFSVAF